MIRVLAIILSLSNVLASPVDLPSTYYIECNINSNDSVFTGFIQIHAHWLRENNVSPTMIDNMSMNNKPTDFEFLEIIKKQTQISVYDYVTKLTLPLHSYEIELTYVDKTNFSKIESRLINQIEVTNVFVDRNHLQGVFFISELSDNNQFWENAPVKIHNVKGCGYLTCDFKVYQYQSNARLFELIDTLNSNENPCHNEPKTKSEADIAMAKWKEVKTQILKTENTIVLGIYCND